MYTHTYTHVHIHTCREPTDQNTHRCAHIHLQYTVTEVCDQTTHNVERGQCHLQARRRIYGVVKLLHFSSRPKMRCDHILRGKNSVRSARQLNLQIKVTIRLTFGNLLTVARSLAIIGRDRFQCVDVFLYMLHYTCFVAFQ